MKGPGINVILTAMSMISTQIWVLNTIVHVGPFREVTDPRAEAGKILHEPKTGNNLKDLLMAKQKNWSNKKLL
jgi:hypothetical protein